MLAQTKLTSAAPQAVKCCTHLGDITVTTWILNQQEFTWASLYCPLPQNLSMFTAALFATHCIRSRLLHVCCFCMPGVKYLCIPAADSPSQNLARHFRESIKFIHECRLTGEGCLVHCLAGVSRSVTLVVAYIMTITDFGWEDALSVVRAARSCANPNMGFQRQLQDFEKHDVDQFRQWLKEEYGENSFQDLQEAKNLLSKYKEQAELQQSTGGRQWNNNFSSVPSLSYNNYTTET
uniref:Dual specificity phosphatase 22 n=1 Tax=Pavo cristatus TaxID=9049 RepID=A0A8C9LAR9_PAVCR